MYENVYSLMDIIQLIATVGVCYLCYTFGWRQGVIDTAEEFRDAMGLDEEEQEDEQE